VVVQHLFHSLPDEPAHSVSPPGPLVPAPSEGGSHGP
jgi:hypothetical protein